MVNSLFVFISVVKVAFSSPPEIGTYNKVYCVISTFLFLHGTRPQAIVTLVVEVKVTLRDTTMSEGAAVRVDIR